MLHTMLRVGNLEKSIEFYTEILGMSILRQSENEEYKYTLVFVGYGEGCGSEIELTYNWGTDKYEQGKAFGHIALGTDDVYDACEKIKSAGGDVVRDAGPVMGGTTVIAFVKDPDGYLIELIQNSDTQQGVG